ncbi:MAG: hypothetical protein IJI98_06740 [Methanosphaera sp.]|uniref:hypothetical protein n=1 Tax=Methanosphaera sp. ISO3-F5 TaxID=1452353 RepID=UPI002B25FE87|nr:hypothetical protein [Methanosphaera sp. ISO3-F5]MBR0472380.1 hypothetical protein [Methanosphaera sp.]WQH63795.1 hypothetical protein PXD04_08835 [Methanosphaera sp. ISO3-F5]
MILNLEYVDVLDIDGMKKIRNDIGLIYLDDDGVYKTARMDFKENFGTLEHYMKTSYELVPIKEFNEKELKIMEEDNFEGKFIYKIVLENGEVLTHEYTFMGIDEDNFDVVPTKIPVKNKYTVDPTKITITKWYYLKNKNNIEYVTLKELTENMEKE